MSTTIDRYLKLLLGQEDIALIVFGIHSTRSASTSKGTNLGLILDDIRKARVGKTNSTFRKHPKLPIYKNLGNTFMVKLMPLGKNVKTFKTKFLGSFTYIKLNLQRSEGMRGVLFCENKLR